MLDSETSFIQSYLAGSTEESNIRAALLCKRWRPQKMRAYLRPMEHQGHAALHVSRNLWHELHTRQHAC